MLLMVDTVIKENVLESIRAVARRCGVSRVVLFGSRARGELRSKSDSVVALFGGYQERFTLDVEEVAPTLLSFDFVNIERPASQDLEAREAQEGGEL